MKPSEMTDQELNEAIAKERGWKKRRGKIIPGEWQWVLYRHGIFASGMHHAPGYAYDWTYAGELLEEMKRDLTFCNEKWNAGNGWVKSPTRAVAEAWYAWKGQE